MQWTRSGLEVLAACSPSRSSGRVSLVLYRRAAVVEKPWRLSCGLWWVHDHWAGHVLHLPSGRCPGVRVAARACCWPQRWDVYEYLGCRKKPDVVWVRFRQCEQPFTDSSFVTGRHN